MQRLLTEDARAAIEAPLKYVVREITPQTTLVHYNQPGNLFAHYKGLASLGKELDEVVTGILSSLPQ